MTTVAKPDATVFDNADDSIATSRAELHTLATSFNTIADEYNAGTLGGGGLPGNYPTATDLGTATSAGEYSLSTPFSVLNSNQPSAATAVSIKFDAQPTNSTWHLLVVRNASGETGSSTVTFTLDSGEDSAGGYSSTSHPVTSVGILFQIRKFSDPAGGNDLFIDLETKTIDSRYTPA